MNITELELKTIVAKLAAIEPESINKNTALVDDLYFDSLRTVELLAILSEEYHIEITEEDALNLNTYDDLFQLTQKNLDEVS